MKPKLQQKHPDSNHIAIKIKPSVFPEEVKNEESFITFRTNLEEANANLVHTIKLYQSRQKNQMSNDIEMKQISSTEDYAIDSISYVFSKYEKNDIPHELVVNIQDIMLNIIRIEHIIHDYKFDEIKKEYIKLNHELKSQIGQAESNYQKTTKIMHQLKQKVDPMVNRMENIWSTILNIIITYTIATTAITAIGKLDVVYIPVFVIEIVFLGITCIAFTSIIFKNYDSEVKKSNVDLAMKIYYITLILFIGTLVSTIFYYFI